jgi:23S rRNA-/tRNA-specific pseudouridylate synthase
VKWKTGLEDLPFQLHRLDKLTTGALLLATNARHAKTFSKQFHDHEIRKSYLAIVRGGRQSFEGVKSGTIDARLSQDGRVRVDDADGSLALTGWELLGSSVSVAALCQ